jgi:hypothetical protein
MEGISGMSLLSDLLGGGSSQGGGGAGVPYGGLIEAQANMPDLPNFKKVNINRILAQADFPDAATAIGQIPDNAPFINPNAPIADGHSLIPVLDEADGVSFVTGGPNELKCLDGADLWALRKDSQLWISDTGVNGPWTNTGLTVTNRSNNSHWGVGWIDGWLVVIDGATDDRGIYINDNQNDYTAWIEFWPPGTAANAGMMDRVYVEGGKFFVQHRRSNGFATDNKYFYVADPSAADPSVPANWSLSSALWGSYNNFSQNYERDIQLFYDPVDDIYIATATDRDTVLDREYWFMKTSTDGVTWTTHPSHNSYTATNDGIYGGQCWRAPDGTRLALFNYDNRNYYRVYGNGWDAAHTAEVNMGTVTGGALNNNNRVQYDIPLIDASGNSLIFFNGASGAQLAKWTWQGLALGFDVSFVGPTNLFDVYFDNVARGIDLNSELNAMIFVPSENAFFILMHDVDPANTNNLYIWKYPLYNYDPTTHFALLSVAHSDPVNITFQARVL